MKNTGRSERLRLRRAIVVGAGRAGLAATLELVAHDVPVLLLSQAPSFQAGSTRDRDGFNAAGGSGRDSTAQHLEDTQAIARGLVSKAALTQLCERAPQLAQWLTSLGVPFAREASGALSRAKLTGSSQARTLHVGANTGRYLISALDALVRAQEWRPARDERGALVPGEKLVRRLNYWRFVSLVFDDHGAVVGVLAQDTHTLTFKAFQGDGVVFAAGDYAAQYAGAASSNDGAALGAVLAQGAVLSNLEFVQHHPLVLARAGASVALPHFLVAQGARVVGRGKTEQDLDLTSLEPELVARLAASLGAPLMKILGVDLSRDTVRVERRAVRGLGGLWVDADPELPADGFSPRQHATNLPGLYACGAAAAQYHGAQALAGNLACADVLGGQLSGRGVVCFREAQEKSSCELPRSLFDKPASAADSDFEALLKRQTKKDSRGPHQILADLRSGMARHVGTSRSAQGLEELMESLVGLQGEAKRASVQGPENGLNQDALLLAALPNILGLARAVVASALAREESRGEHQRADFVDQSDEFTYASLLRRGADGDPELTSNFEYEAVGQTIRVGK